MFKKRIFPAAGAALMLGSLLMPVGTAQASNLFADDQSPVCSLRWDINEMTALRNFYLAEDADWLVKTALDAAKGDGKAEYLAFRTAFDAYVTDASTKDIDPQKLDAVPENVRTTWKALAEKMKIGDRADAGLRILLTLVSSFKADLGPQGDALLEDIDNIDNIGKEAFLHHEFSLGGMPVTGDEYDDSRRSVLPEVKNRQSICKDLKRNNLQTFQSKGSGWNRDYTAYLPYTVMDWMGSDYTTWRYLSILRAFFEGIDPKVENKAVLNKIAELAPSASSTRANSRGQTDIDYWRWTSSDKSYTEQNQRDLRTGKALPGTDAEEYDKWLASNKEEEKKEAEKPATTPANTSSLDDFLKIFTSS
ncbi:MAG: hypothetical protein Q3972_08010 [Corynebacterium sp.]|nr:hypothetical protein [Corynebacterium sp.]